MARNSSKGDSDPRRNCPHAALIGRWEAKGLDLSIVESLRFLDAAHELNPLHLERIRELFTSAAVDFRWGALGDDRPTPGNRLYLDDALRILPAHDALSFFEGADLFCLYERLGAFAFLTDHNTPFYTLSELATTTHQALRCLERNREYLLKYGHALTDFQRCRQFSDLVSRLYYVRLPHSAWRRRAALVPQPLLRKLFPPDNPPEPGDFVYFADKGNKPEVSAYKSWEPIDDIPEADQGRLTQMRASLYALKTKVLDLLERAARSRCADGLWEKCSGLIADSVTAEEAEFCLRVDRVYEGYDIKTGNLVDEEAGLIAGGLTKLLETIGHCEKELVIGTLCRCKELLGSEGLAGLDNLGRGEVRTSGGERARSYFEFVPDPKRQVMDAAVDEFLRLSEQEVKFWQEYTTRVARYFENELYEEVGVKKKVRRRFAHKFQPQLARYADLLAGHLEVTGELPDMALGTDKKADRERGNQPRGSKNPRKVSSPDVQARPAAAIDTAQQPKGKRPDVHQPGMPLKTRAQVEKPVGIGGDSRDEQRGWQYLKDSAEQEREELKAELRPPPFRVLRHADGTEVASLLDALVVGARETWSAYALLCRTPEDDVSWGEEDGSPPQWETISHPFFDIWDRTFESLMEAEQWFCGQYGPGRDTERLDVIANAMMDLDDILEALGRALPGTGEDWASRLAAQQQVQRAAFQTRLKDLHQAARTLRADSARTVVSPEEQIGAPKADGHQQAVSPDKKEPDGPHPPDEFWWHGQRLTLQRMQWRVLDFMWQRDQASANELAEHVWREKWDDADVPSSSNISTALSRLNKTLQKLKTTSPLPFVRLEYKGGYVRKVKRKAK